MKRMILFIAIYLQINFAGNGGITGKIVDSESNEQIVYANVFLSGTTIGSTTNDNGEYQIIGVPEGNYKLVVSVVGYEAGVKNIQVKQEDELEFDFELIRKVYEFDEIDVVGEYDEEYEANYLKFRKHFLGTSKNALSCEIENPGILDFRNNGDGSLTAIAKEMIKITNNNLGYKIQVNLQDFKITKLGEVYYAGETFFVEIDTNDFSVEKQWERNRREAYLGSSRHFFKSLYSDEWYSAGYRTYLSDKPSWNSVYDLMQQKQPISHNLVENITPRSDGFKKLKLDDHILIKYVKKVEAGEYYSYRESMDSKIYEILPYQISWLELINDECEFDENGLLKYPENSIKVFGYWGWLKMGDLLPFDYKPTES